MYDDTTDVLEENIDEDTPEGLSLQDDEVIEERNPSFVAKTDETRISAVATAFPDHPGMRALLDRATRFGQLHSDKDASIADLVTDITSELYVLVLELERNPVHLILAALGRMSELDQLELIKTITSELEVRRSLITGNLEVTHGK